MWDLLVFFTSDELVKDIFHDASYFILTNNIKCKWLYLTRDAIFSVKARVSQKKDLKNVPEELKTE